jgi:hypothetical protein
VNKLARHICNNTSQIAKNSTKPGPTPAAVKLLPKAVLNTSSKTFSLLRTTGMDTEITGAEHTLPENEAPRKADRPPLIMTTSTTRVETKEMAIYSVTNFCLEKHDLQFFTSLANSESL